MRTSRRPRVGVVNLTFRGVRDSVSHGIGPAKAAAFAAVPYVIQQGRVFSYDKNWKKRGYDSACIAAPITIGNEEYICEVIVRTVEGHPNRFYLHEVNARKAPAGTLQTPTGRASTSESARPVSSIFVDKYQEVKGETSKVVDENGEPLVVYHVTDSDFNTFDLSKARQSSDIPAFFFSSGTEDWAAMGSRVVPVFLNIRNPTEKPIARGDGAAAREQLIKEGYDGTIEAEEGMETEYAALYPEQIKSAVGNNGNFDPRDANIYNQRLCTALSSDLLFARQWSSTVKDLDDDL